MFVTTPEEAALLPRFEEALALAELDFVFITAVIGLASTDHGAFGLLSCWFEATDAAEKCEAIADLYELVEDHLYLPHEPTYKPLPACDQIDAMLATLMDEKRQLRELIDTHGGLGVVVAKTGIPEAALNRILMSARVPWRGTLDRIASALDLPASAIKFTWTR